MRFLFLSATISRMSRVHSFEFAFADPIPTPIRRKRDDEQSAVLVLELQRVGPVLDGGLEEVPEHRPMLLLAPDHLPAVSR
jgi:hypothetical protein